MAPPYLSLWLKVVLLYIAYPASYAQHNNKYNNAWTQHFNYLILMTAMVNGTKFKIEGEWLQNSYYKTLITATMNDGEWSISKIKK